MLEVIYVILVAWLIVGSCVGYTLLGLHISYGDLDVNKRDFLISCIPTMYLFVLLKNTYKELEE